MLLEISYCILIIAMQKNVLIKFRALLCESIRALIFPSRMSCISSSSSADTVVLNASAIFRMSADKYGLKYCQANNNRHSTYTFSSGDLYSALLWEAPLLRRSDMGRM